MRVLVGLVAASLGLAVSLPMADARPIHRAGRPPRHQEQKSKKRAARIHTLRERTHLESREIARGQSVGAPWDGRLQHATELPRGDSYYIRRPSRAFGTQTTIELTLRAIGETLEAYPDEHVLAIGDISQASGGRISDHHSHQSGRDIDVGLFYVDKPAGYPAGFVHADEDNLDCAATFKLLESFLATADEDGGVQMVFLDFDVQGILYDWARDHGVSERRLERIFQYPHGRDASEGIVRHEPNHDNHMHVRFRCPSSDSVCQ
jgi:hypothetical protein